jgi:hypothetical protein
MLTINLQFIIERWVCSCSIEKIVSKIKRFETVGILSSAVVFSFVVRSIEKVAWPLERCQILLQTTS